MKAPESGKPQPDRPITNDGTAEGTRKEDRDGPRLIHRVYTVFNAKQIEGVPCHTSKATTPFEAVQAGEQILISSGAKIKHDRVDRTFYSRAHDSIHLPPKAAFQDAPGYYGTALHELAHWTGHPSRLNRATLNEAYRFGDAQYAKEELRAELASVFLAAERGIPHDSYQHAAYVGHWIKALKEDKHEIFRAAHDASAATECLLTLERDRSLSDQPDATKRVFQSGVNGQTVTSTTNAPEGSQGVPRKETRSAHKTDPAANGPETVRETHQHVTRLERSSGTVNVHDKQTATDQRSTIDDSSTKRTANPDAKAPSIAEHTLSEAHTIAASLLGTSARVYRAQTESGIYRGPIIGVADGHVVQRLSAQSAVAHPKNLLDKHPAVGENVAVTYSASKGAVRELQERVKSPDRGR